MLIYFVWVLTLYVRIALRCFLMKTQWKAPLRLSISILCGATLPDSTWVILGRSEKPCLTNCDMMAKNHGDSGEFKVLTIHIYICIYIYIYTYIYIYISSSHLRFLDLYISFGNLLGWPGEWDIWRAQVCQHVVSTMAWWSPMIYKPMGYYGILMVNDG